ncbi:MAG: DUF418 domain-containing protein [Saprospiraceae bacterium]|nr:DUF418 domain-containing protein [Saprospiraceae bacterium]
MAIARGKSARRQLLERFKIRHFDRCCSKQCERRFSHENGISVWTDIKRLSDFRLVFAGNAGGRRRYFENIEVNKIFTKKVFKWSIIIFFSLFVIAAIIFGLFSKYIPQSLQMPIGMTVYDLSNIAMTFFFITTFMLLFNKERWQKRLNVFAPYGRMALTNYVMQSVVGVVILFGYGFGLLAEVGSTITLLIALIVCALQIWISKIWLQYYNYSPLGMVLAFAHLVQMAILAKARKIKPCVEIQTGFSATI